MPPISPTSQPLKQVRWRRQPVKAHHHQLPDPVGKRFHHERLLRWLAARLSDFPADHEFIKRITLAARRRICTRLSILDRSIRRRCRPIPIARRRPSRRSQPESRSRWRHGRTRLAYLFADIKNREHGRQAESYANSQSQKLKYIIQVEKEQKRAEDGETKADVQERLVAVGAKPAAPS